MGHYDSCFDEHTLRVECECDVCGVRRNCEVDSLCVHCQRNTPSLQGRMRILYDKDNDIQSRIENIRRELDTIDKMLRLSNKQK